jgi:uncharacterized protein YqeY
MLIEKVRERLTQAIKSQDVIAKSVLRAILSKAQNSGVTTDSAVISTVKMLINQNEDEISGRSGRVPIRDDKTGEIKEYKVVEVSNQEGEIKRLNAETLLLKEFLPDFLSSDRIKEILTESLDQILASKNSGAATGVAMKILAPFGAVEGGTVKNVVMSIWSKE